MKNEIKQSDYWYDGVFIQEFYIQYDLMINDEINNSIVKGLNRIFTGSMVFTKEMVNDVETLTTFLKRENILIKLSRGMITYNDFNQETYVFIVDFFDEKTNVHIYNDYVFINPPNIFESIFKGPI